MDPRRAWDAVLDQLQREMANAAFETWVKDAEFLSFDAGVFKIGVKDSYTREWLSSRLTAVVDGLLRGMLDRSSIEVQFVQSAFTAAEESSFDEDDGALETELPPEEKGIAVSIERSLLGSFTKPDSALYFPGYWLRWVPYIGAKAFATILAFRQALYLTEGTFKESHYFPVSEESVGEIIGVTRQTIARQRDGYTTASGKYTPPQLDWFLSVKKSSKVNYSSQEQRFVKEAHKYAFKTSPITPGDMAEIIEWLIENGLEKDPEKALRRAIEIQPKEILSFPMKKPTKVQLRTKPSTAASDLLANILAYCPPKMSKQVRQSVMVLTDQLRDRIIESDGQVKVPLYFLKHVMPHVGVTPAVLIIYLRKRAYRNAKTGEIRERVVLHEGVDELANFLGLARNSIYTHLPSDSATDTRLVERREKIGKYLSCISKTASGKDVITVATADALVPDHEEEYIQATALANFLITRASPEEIQAVFDHIKQRRNESENVTIGLSDNVTLGLSDNVTIAVSENETLDESENAAIGSSDNVTHPLLTAFGKYNNTKYLNFKYLKPEILRELILELKTNLNTLTTTYTPEDLPEIEWIQPVRGKWEFSDLFKSCRIDGKTQKAVHANQATATAFVSHMLYAFSPEGDGLNHPLRFALTQILREGDGNLGHGPRHDRLALLGPAGLQELIRRTTVQENMGFRVDRGITGANDWEQIMKDHKKITPIIELGELLGLLHLRYR